MRRSVNWFTKSIWLLVSAAILAGAVVVIRIASAILSTDDAASWGSCISEVFGEAHVAGLDFKFVDMSCDILAKSEAISIFASKAGAASGGDVEIFKYDGPMVPPTITEIDPHTIRISVGAISFVYFAKKRLGDIAILYDIGHISYPGPDDPPEK